MRARGQKVLGRTPPEQGQGSWMQSLGPVFFTPAEKKVRLELSAANHQGRLVCRFSISARLSLFATEIQAIPNLEKSPAQNHC